MGMKFALYIQYKVNIDSANEFFSNTLRQAFNYK